MNKKLVAVAIAGLLAAPLAQAQTANVTLYGRINMDLEFVNGKQLAPVQPLTCTPASNSVNTCNLQNPNQYRVSSDSSRFGIRGTESLGGGLSAIFQVENSLAMDNSQASPAPDRVLANRDSFVGLSGGFGRVYMGYYHLPYDNIHDIWGSATTLSTGILATSSIWAQGFASKANGGFDSRIGNSVRWDTPVMSGWQGQFSYSIGGGATGQEGTPKSNSSVSSGGVFYNSGPIVFGAAFQYNAQVRAAGLSDLAYSFTGSYQFPGVKIGAVYERLEYDCQGFPSGPVVNPLTPAQIAAACVTSPTTSGTSTLTRNFYGVGLTVNAGPGVFYADWSFGDDGGGSAPNGARVGGLAKGENSSSNQWEVSYVYPLSRRTSLYTGYTQIVNKSNANYNFSVNSYTIAIGGKPQGFVMGMWHNF